MTWRSCCLQHLAVLEAAGQGPWNRAWARRNPVPAAEMASGGTTAPPPPISLQNSGRFRVCPEDAGELGERRQLPPTERVSPRSRAPSASYRSRAFRVQLPPPPPFDSALACPTAGEASLMASLSLVECPERAKRVEGHTARLTPMAFCYILRCADGSYYVGSLAISTPARRCCATTSTARWGSSAWASSRRSPRRA